VVTLNGWTLPWRMNKGVKEFHLVAEPVVREMAPGMKAHLWGYNGQSPGPTIEVVEGDRVRIFVTNKLPEHTSMHWHGQRLPNGMDGVAGLTSPPSAGQDLRLRVRGAPPGHLHVPPACRRDGADGHGHDGLLGHAPESQAPADRRGDRDFCFLLNAYDIEPGSYTPKVMTMTDFNLWTWNSRIFPGIDS
jgi:FtsP/CotA-like multicopper oxidase with cupredoxin domain